MACFGVRGLGSSRVVVTSIVLRSSTLLRVPSQACWNPCMVSMWVGSHINIVVKSVWVLYVICVSLWGLSVSRVCIAVGCSHMQVWVWGMCVTWWMVASTAWLMACIWSAPLILLVWIYIYSMCAYHMWYITKGVESCDVGQMKMCILRLCGGVIKASFSCLVSRLESGWGLWCSWGCA